MTDFLSLEELSSGKAAAPPPPKGSDFISLIDLDPAARPEPKPTPGVLANAADDTDAMAMAKGAGTAAIRLLSQIPGFAGNLREGANALGAAVPAGWNAMMYGKNFPQEFGRQIDKNRAAQAYMHDNPILGFNLPEPPSAADISGPILERTGEYKPTGTGGALAMAGAEGLGAAVAPGGFAGKVPGALSAELPKLMPYLGNLMSGAAGGAGTEAGMRLSDNPWVAGGAGLLASLFPQVGFNAAAARTEGAAQRLAGQAMRDATVDPDSTAAALEHIPSAPVPGARLTSAQVSQDPGLDAIETSMAQKTAREGTFASQIAEDNATSQAALETAAAKAVKASAKQPYVVANVGGTGPEELSTKAREIFTKAEEAADQVQSQAWQVPSLQGARMFKNKTLGAIQDSIDNMSVADSEYIGTRVGRTLEKLNEKYKGQIPMHEIKSLHSNLLKDARQAAYGMNANPNEARVFGNLADAVKDTLFDDQNYSYRAKDMLKDFAAAKQATAQYYGTFGGPMRDLLVEPTRGVERVASEATLAKLMRGDNAPQNIRLFRGAVGKDADDLLSDFVVSDLTGHGMKLPQPDQVEKYMIDNAGKIAEVPGLDKRLAAIKSASRSDLVSQGIAQHVESPARLFEFLDSNKADVNAVFTNPKQKELVEQIKDTARRLSKIPEGEIGSKETFNQVTNGRVLDVLLGSTVAKGLGITTGAALGHAISQKFPGLDGLLEVGGAVAGAGLHGTPKDHVGQITQALVMGNNQDRVKELLMEGLRDPKVGAMLMRKADPDTIAAVFQKVPANLSSTMPTLAEAPDRYGTPPARGYAAGGAVRRLMTLEGLPRLSHRGM